MKKSIRRLPDGELEVMQAVWDCQPPVSRHALEEKLGGVHAPTTVLTLLSRLAEKGFLAVDKQGRGNVYTPLVTRQDYLAAQSRRFLDTLCRGSLGVFAAALCDSGLSKEDIEELRALLDKGGL